VQSYTTGSVYSVSHISCKQIGNAYVKKSNPETMVRLSAITHHNLVVNNIKNNI